MNGGSQKRGENRFYLIKGREIRGVKKQVEIDPNHINEVPVSDACNHSNKAGATELAKKPPKKGDNQKRGADKYMGSMEASGQKKDASVGPTCYRDLTLKVLHGLKEGKKYPQSNRQKKPKKEAKK